MAAVAMVAEEEWLPVSVVLDRIIDGPAPRLEQTPFRVPPSFSTRKGNTVRRLSSWSQFAAELRVAPRSAEQKSRVQVWSTTVGRLKNLGSSGPLWCCLAWSGFVLAGLVGCSNGRAPGSNSWIPMQSVGGQWEPDVDYEAERAALEREQQEKQTARKKPTADEF